jgi:hypothetical protein
VRLAARRYGLHAGGVNAARQMLASPQEASVIGTPRSDGPPEPEQLTLL